MTLRVVVFIDYQNTYRSARRAFGFDDSHHVDGQFHPRSVGEMVARRYSDPAVLHQVRLYRGRPSNRHDPKGYAAAQRQVSIWKKTNLVVVTERNLWYPSPGSSDQPREKGVDVSLAIDFVMMAVRGEYDVGVVFSGDADLLPAVEEVHQIDGAEPAVAAWEPDDGHGRRLRPSGIPVRCHWLNRGDYESLRDLRDYTVKA